MTPTAISPEPGVNGVLQLEAVVHDPEWPDEVAAPAHLGAIAAAIARKLAFDRPEAAAIAFSDDRAVQALNARYRGKDAPTNVLSFPAAETAAAALAPGQPWPLGDIVLARETVLREAADQGIDFAAHTTHLIVHGVLHLLGYDHVIDRDAEEMEALEIEILAELGIGNPYTEESIGSD